MKMDSCAAAEFNPYVAPIAADSYDTTDRGIGVWRDRWLLVMHKDASLPAICIKTGEPADRFLPFDWLGITRSTGGLANATLIFRSASADVASIASGNFARCSYPPNCFGHRFRRRREPGAVYR